MGDIAEGRPNDRAGDLRPALLVGHIALRR